MLLPLLSFAQNEKPYEEYYDGKLIKTLNKDGFQVSSSLRAIARNDGKYYMFDISIANNSGKTKNFRVADCKAFIVQVDEKKLKKGKLDKAYDYKELEILRSKDYQKIKERKGVWRRIGALMAASSAAEDAGTVTTASNVNVRGNSSSYGSNDGNVTVYDQYNNKLGSATVNQSNFESSRTTINGNSNTVTRDGAAVYAARQNEERKLNEFYRAQEEARLRWNEAYLKSNTLSPLETTSGILNVKYEKGDFLELHVIIEEFKFIFKWDPDDSEN